MNIRKLKAKLVERDVSIADLASILNVDKSTVYRKFNKSGESFTVSDVDKIAKALSLTYKDINEIFFANVVAQYATAKGGTMKIVKLITKATHQSIVEAMISIAIAHGLTITNVEDIMTDVIAYLKDNATLIKIELS